MTKRYIRTFFAIVVVSLVGAALINLVVDPWRVTPEPLSSDAFEPYRDLDSQIRTGKCGFIRSAPSIGVALIGSSRVTNSLDPRNPNWGREDVYNLGGNASYIYENEAIFRYLLQKQSPELVIIGIDPGDLSSTFDTRIIFDFNGSPLGPDQDRIDREIRYLVGISTLEASFETIKRRLTDEVPQYDDRGLRRHRPKRQIDQRAFLAAAIIGESQFEAPQSAGEDTPIRPDKLKRLGGIVETCLQRGIRLVLLIHPQHALSHTRSGEEAMLPFERERRDITYLVDRLNQEKPDAVPAEVWDFGDYHPINCEPLPTEKGGRMQNWDDFNHYTLEVGDLMLARIMGWPIEMEGGEDYGLQLDPANFDAWLEHAKAGNRRYIEGVGKADIEWAQGLSNKEGSE
ncbi:hypothetical protein ACFQY0_00265 [Haloferula chungangensis]|uniref:SGNH/GDSL hydrolase family protein n=1 Tax=Haloferula chungangensis TaxID=1048331 RepID=A0ABW2KZX2_9BACT